jgi:hypothetical protein
MKTSFDKNPMNSSTASTNTLKQNYNSFNSAQNIYNSNYNSNNDGVNNYDSLSLPLFSNTEIIPRNTLPQQYQVNLFEFSFFRCR